MKQDPNVTMVDKQTATDAEPFISSVFLPQPVGPNGVPEFIQHTFCFVNQPQLKHKVLLAPPKIYI